MKKMDGEYTAVEDEGLMVQVVFYRSFLGAFQPVSVRWENILGCQVVDILPLLQINLFIIFNKLFDWLNVKREINISY